MTDTMTLTDTQTSNARVWAEDCGKDTEGMTDAAVVRWVAARYEGGLAGFVKDCGSDEW